MRAGCLLIVVSSLVVFAGCGQRRGSAARSALPSAVNSAEEGARSIPAGTTLVLSVIPRLNADGKSETILDAVVMQDVQNEQGQVLIGKGSPAKLAIVDGKPALRTVIIYGNAYRVRAAGSPDRLAPLEIVSDSSSVLNLKASEIIRFQTSTPSLLIRPR